MPYSNVHSQCHPLQIRKVQYEAIVSRVRDPLIVVQMSLYHQSVDPLPINPNTDYLDPSY